MRGNVLDLIGRTLERTSTIIIFTSQFKAPPFVSQRMFYSPQFPVDKNAILKGRQNEKNSYVILMWEFLTDDR